MTQCRYSAIQTLGTVDGPGVRFVLFLQGCPLHCGYCHNPETRDMTGGKTATVGEIMQKVLRCRSYFGKDGGITVSGGEPLVQAEFVTELFTECKKQGINTCLDTSGCILNDSVIRLLEVTDLCMLDIKMTNEEDYKKHIGCSMATPLAFLDKLSEMKVETWIRQVIVCGVNDDDINIGRLNEIANAHDNVTLAELLPFRKLCSTKYDEMGIPFPFDCYEQTPESVIETLKVKVDKFSY